MSQIHYISSEILDLKIISSILDEHKKLKLSEECVHTINASRAYLDKKIKEMMKV